MDQIRLPQLARLNNALRRGRGWYRRQMARWQRVRPAAEGMSEAAALAALKQDRAQQRWEAATVLGKDSLRSRDSIAGLVVALADPEPFVRWQSAEALAAQEPGRVFPVLRALLSDRNALRRAGAAEALGRMGGEAAAVALRGALEDGAAVVRASAARALGLCGDPSTAPVLLPLLSDPDAEVRCAAATALGHIGSPNLAYDVAEALLQPGQPLLVRRALTAALVHIPHPEIQSILLIALVDPDAQVRGYAAEALGQVGSEEAYELLAAAREDFGVLLHGKVADVATRALDLLDRRGRRAPAIPTATAADGDQGEGAAA